MTRNCHVPATASTVAEFSAAAESILDRQSQPFDSKENKGRRSLGSEHLVRQNTPLAYPHQSKREVFGQIKTLTESNS